MAFEARGCATYPSTSGWGGFMVYSTNVDDLNGVKGAGYWDRDLSSTANREHRRARENFEDFVRDQSIAGARGVPILINASNGMEWNEARLTSAGRITMANGGWIID